MAGRDAVPALLKPLANGCVVVHGGVPATELLSSLVGALEQPNAWRTIRVRPGRAVFEIRAGGEYLVKAYEASFMARMSPLRFCASGRELHTLEAASLAGLPTPRAMALYSARGKPSVNFLVIEKVAGTSELESYLQREQDRLREDTVLSRRFIADFAGFVASLHKGGLLHKDLHLRNILVRPPRAGNPAGFFVIDLAGEEVTGTTPPEPARRANLAQLALCFPEAQATARRRFLREYRARMADTGPERDAAHDIEQQAIQRQFDLNTMRIATCAEASSAIARVEKQNTLLLIYRRADGTDLEQLESPLAKAAPQDWHRTIFDHFELRLGEGSIWKLRSPLESADEGSRRRKLEALWGRLLELHAIRAPAPTPLACLADGQQIIVYARVPGPLTPMVKLKDHGALVLFEDLGRRLLRLHRAGCFFLPLETATLAEGLNVASARRGARSVMLTAPDHIFRGSPTALGPQAVASLGRVGRTLLEHSGERQMKELVWSYARVLRLNHFDTNSLLNEARRVPTGNTLVVTRGIEKSRLDR